MTKPSQTLKERLANSKRGTWVPPDPKAPVTIVVGGRPKAKEK